MATSVSWTENEWMFRATTDGRTVRESGDSVRGGWCDETVDFALWVAAARADRVNHPKRAAAADVLAQRGA